MSDKPKPRDEEGNWPDGGVVINAYDDPKSVPDAAEAAAKATGEPAPKKSSSKSSSSES
jgi:hypothetical protein